MKKETDYGKIIAITLAIITAASTIAYVIFRLSRAFFAFCHAYGEPQLEEWESTLSEKETADETEAPLDETVTDETEEILEEQAALEGGDV